MKREIVGQGTVVVLVIAIVAAVVGGAIGYLAKPTPTFEELEEEIDELNATISELNSTISDKDATIADKMAKISDLMDQISDLESPLPGGGFNVPLVCHGGRGNPFWETVFNGYEHAKKMFNIQGEMYRPDTEGDLEWQLSTLESLLAAKPDAVITTIPNPDMFDDVIADMEAAGIPVICINTDDPKGAEGNERQCYIGQDLVTAGRKVVDAIFDKYWEETMGSPIDPSELKIVIPKGGPGLVWCEYRYNGITDRLKELGVSEDQWEWIETKMDPSDQMSVMVAYLSANPDTNLIISTQTNGGDYLAMKDMGLDPDSIVSTGFDLIPIQLDGLEEGYLEATVDQQPYLQGFYTVAEAYFHLQFGMSFYDIDTGCLIVGEDMVPLIREWAEKGFIG